MTDIVKPYRQLYFQHECPYCKRTGDKLSLIYHFHKVGPCDFHIYINGIKLWDRDFFSPQDAISDLEQLLKGIKDCIKLKDGGVYDERT